MSDIDGGTKQGTSSDKTEGHVHAQTREESSSESVVEKEAYNNESVVEKEAYDSIAAPSIEDDSNNSISQPDSDIPPDGGREAWLCVLGGVCSWFATFGWVYSVGEFQEYYSQGPLRNYSPSDVGWISSTEAFFAFASCPIAGKIFDNYGARGLLLVGSFMHVFGLMMASLGRQYYQFFLAQSVCSGIGVSLVFTGSVNAATTWFLKKRATAMGIMTAGSSVGGVVLPILITKLIPDIGFPWTLRIVAFIFLAFLMVMILTMKSRLVHKPKPFHLMEFVTPLSDVPFAMLCIAGSCAFLGSFLPYNFIVLQGQRNGMSYSLSNYLIPVMNAASFPGRLVFGALADRYGRFNMLILGSLIATIFTFALWIPAHSNAPIFVFATISGLSSGAIFSVGPAAIAQISELHEIGIRSGTLFFCLAIGSLIGNPIGGALVSANGGNHLYVQIFSGAILALSSVCFFVGRSLKTGFLKVKIF